MSSLTISRRNSGVLFPRNYGLTIIGAKSGSPAIILRTLRKLQSCFPATHAAVGRRPFFREGRL
jgi:hypothetical protein